MSTAEELTLTCTLALWTVVLAGAALRALTRRQDSLPLQLLATGLIASCVEGLYDVLLDFIYLPALYSPIAYTTAGRPVPLWVVLAYTNCIATCAWLSLTLLRSRGLRPARTVFLGWALFDLLAEALVHGLGGYLYRGHQPFTMLGIPYVWPVVYAASFVTTGCLMARTAASRPTRPWRVAVTIAAGPVAMLGGLVVFGWPVLAVIHLNGPRWAASLCALLTLAAAVTAVEVQLRRCAALPARDDSAPGVRTHHDALSPGGA